MKESFYNNNLAEEIAPTSTDFDIEAVENKKEKTFEIKEYWEGELQFLRENLENRELPMMDVAKIGKDNIENAFAEYQQSTISSERNIWQRVQDKLKEIDKKSLSPFSWWSLLKENANENFIESIISIRKMKKLIPEVEGRGFEYVTDVNIKEVEVLHISKNEQQVSEVEGTKYTLGLGSPMKVSGKIVLDSPLITDKEEEFDWEARVYYEAGNTLWDMQLRKHLGNIPAHMTTEIGVNFYRQDWSKEDKFINFSRANITGNIRDSRESHMGPKLDDLWSSRAIDFDTLTSINREVSQKIHNQIDLYMNRYVKPERFTKWNNIQADYELDTAISGKSEEQIDSMFLDGLKTGKFDSMLLYVGDGAQKFLDLTASENYKVTNKEYLLMQKHHEEICENIIKSEIYELGPGDGKKTKELLAEVAKQQEKEKGFSYITYHPIDINPTMIYSTAETLQGIENVDIQGQVCDFHDLEGKVSRLENSFLLLGNTLGNGDKNYQIDLLQDIRKAMKNGEKMIIGVQLKTDLKEIAKGYQGDKVTSFVKQLMSKFSIKEEELDYEAVADEERNQVSCRLIFKEDKQVFYHDYQKQFRKGDAVETIVSHKYELTELPELLAASGLRLVKSYVNEQQDYEVVVAEAI